MADQISSSTFTNDNYLLAVAIDFGTTYSGYAYSFKTSPNDITMNKNWGAELGCESYKAPTCVMTKPDGSFHSFGYKAEYEYSQLEPSEVTIGGPRGYNLYRHFKMLLHDKGVSQKMTVVSTSGHCVPALDIFTMALKYLHGHLMTPLKNALKSPPGISDIRWVLTVPAIWSDESKSFMREAAFKAGLIAAKNSNNLLIALEPEAASIYCRSLDMNPCKNNESDENQFKSGQGLLVVDAGGGTVDITVHKIQADGKVKEIAPPSGGPWGGCQVDAAFVKLLTKIFGSDFINTFKIKEPQQWLQFMTNFEKSKKAFIPDGEHSLKIGAPYSLDGELRDYDNSSIKKALTKFGKPGISFSNGFITLKYDSAMELFTSTVNSITSHVTSLLSSQQNKIDYTLLVGGFGECKVLQQACKEAFGRFTKVLIPGDAQLAIIKGAILYGHNPMQVYSRIARYTYGREIVYRFDYTKHEVERKESMRNEEYCKGCFQKYVTKGEEVVSGKTKHFKSQPLKKGTPYISLKFFRTELQNPTYVDEPGITKIATARLESTRGALSDNIETRVTFGHTEILVEARDKDIEDDFPLKVTLDFM